MIDDIIYTANECIKVLRRAEKFIDNENIFDVYITQANGYLDYLEKESPLLYRVLLPEYLKLVNNEGGFEIKNEKESQKK